MLQELCLAMGNGHIETLMLMEWYIALFTCKTTAHCVFYIKCITCRHYLGVGTGGGGTGGTLLCSLYVYYKN